MKKFTQEEMVKMVMAEQAKWLAKRPMVCA